MAQSARTATATASREARKLGSGGASPSRPTSLGDGYMAWLQGRVIPIFCRNGDSDGEGDAPLEGCSRAPQVPARAASKRAPGAATGRFRRGFPESVVGCAWNRPSAQAPYCLSAYLHIPVRLPTGFFARRVHHDIQRRPHFARALFLPPSPPSLPLPKAPPQAMDKMTSNGIRRKDTTKGPPLRILSLGDFLPHMFVWLTG